LHGFKRPRDAQEIAHPPLWSRAANYAYLVLIGIFGVLAGIVAFNVLPAEGMPDMARQSMLQVPGGDRVVAGFATPSRTVVLRGGETLEPNLAQETFAAGETVAFVITNATGERHVFAVLPMSGMPGSEADQPAAENSQLVPSHEITILPGETETLVYRFDVSGPAAFTWASES
jgi:FtsP/CotA-like multicopper oxidase with cupredoxin domain